MKSSRSRIPYCILYYVENISKEKLPKYGYKTTMGVLERNKDASVLITTLEEGKTSQIYGYSQIKTFDLRKEDTCCAWIEDI